MPGCCIANCNNRSEKGREEDEELKNNTLGLLTRLKSYKENILHFPKVEFFNYIVRAEMYFRGNKHLLINNKKTFIDVSNEFLGENQYSASPTCHPIVNKIVHIFVRTRFFFSLRHENKFIHKKIVTNSVNIRSSKSIAMRVLANKMQ